MMTTAVLNLPERGTAFRMAASPGALTSSMRGGLTRLPIMTGSAGLAVLPRAIAPSTQDKLPSPVMSQVTIDGRPIPVFPGMNGEISVRALKGLLDLPDTDQLLMKTARSRARILKDDDLIDLAAVATLLVIASSLAS